MINVYTNCNRKVSLDIVWNVNYILIAEILKNGTVTAIIETFRKRCKKVQLDYFVIVIKNLKIVTQITKHCGKSKLLQLFKISLPLLVWWLLSKKDQFCEKSTLPCFRY